MGSLQHEAVAPTAAGRRVRCQRLLGQAKLTAAIGVAPSAYSGVGPGHVAVGLAQAVGSDAASTGKASRRAKISVGLATVGPITV
jgi:hypothetical protein